MFLVQIRSMEDHTSLPKIEIGSIGPKYINFFFFLFYFLFVLFFKRFGYNESKRIFWLNFQIIYYLYFKVDNGWIRFNKVRIPRHNMMSKFSKVTREGKYIKPPHSKLSYSSMVVVRVDIVRRSFPILAKATTIAIRYSVVKLFFIFLFYFIHFIFYYKGKKTRIPERTR